MPGSSSLINTPPDGPAAGSVGDTAAGTAVGETGVTAVGSSVAAGGGVCSQALRPKMSASSKRVREKVREMFIRLSSRLSGGMAEMRNGRKSPTPEKRARLYHACPTAAEFRKAAKEIY